MAVLFTGLINRRYCFPDRNILGRMIPVQLDWSRPTEKGRGNFREQIIETLATNNHCFSPKTSHSYM